jgi:hypothetical protein
MYKNNNIILSDYTNLLATKETIFLEEYSTVCKNRIAYKIKSAMVINKNINLQQIKKNE